ncbi:MULTISPECIES: hypothetical protein [Bacillus cereus group]|uniref:hypothetical protein n=1 Tax=Bacillus cereus group TaxID=86661 RepID=UPI0005A32F73|nr:hypothetical protein [Bacillus cereus]AJG62278.1 hypothetical protein AW22_2326 [Bacillus cereus D17]BCD05260.1 hypothetical protein BC30052_2315 [Bacillus cereus]SME51625.1 hypothetical protein BACERE00175_05543 [Bacillus cereus]
MEKKPIVFKVPPNSKLKVTFFGPCNEVITNVSIINQLSTPKCQTITRYPNYTKYEIRNTKLKCDHCPVVNLFYTHSL